MCVCVYIYIYIYVCVCVYIYVYMYRIYIHIERITFLNLSLFSLYRRGGTTSGHNQPFWFCIPQGAGFYAAGLNEVRPVRLLKRITV